MRNLRFYYRLTISYVSKFKLLIVTGLLLGLILSIVLTVIYSKYFVNNTLRIGVTGRYSSSTLPYYITTLFAKGLFKTDKTLMMVPDLAEQYSISQDNIDWTVKIKNDIFWNDGTRINSHDIKYDLSGLNVKQIDDVTLEFNLNEPFMPFLSLLSRPIFKKGFIGSSEWKVKNIIISDNIIRELHLYNNKKNFVIYKFYPTEEKTKTAFILGKIDKIENLYNPLPFSKWKNTQTVKSTNKNQVVTLFFNTKDKLLSDKDLRQALHYAIDRAKFNKVSAFSSINPDSWAYNPQVKKYNFDTVRAIELIDSLPEEINKDINIRIVSSPNLIDDAEIIKKSWDDIGIKVNIAVSSVPPSDYQVFLTVFDSPTDPDQYIYWHSTQNENNWSNYSNPRIDKLLEDGRKLSNVEDRKKTYLDFQRYLSEDVPAIFLYHPDWFDIIRGR